MKRKKNKQNFLSTFYPFNFFSLILPLLYITKDIIFDLPFFDKMSYYEILVRY